MMDRNQLGDKFLKGLSAELVQVMDQADKDYSLISKTALGVGGNVATSLFKYRTSGDARATFGGLNQLGDMEETNESESYKTDKYTSNYETQFDFKQWTKRVQITEMNIEDAKVQAQLLSAGRTLTAGKRTINKHTMSIFNSAFTAQASLASEAPQLGYFGDGKPLCSVAHPLKDNDGVTTTDSNASATGLVFSETNLRTAINEMMETLGNRSELLGYGTGHLILLVPHTMEKHAVEATRSVLRSGTANNDINVYDGQVTVMASKWISGSSKINGKTGSDTAWFLIDALNSPLTVINRVALHVKPPWMDKDNYTTNIDIRARYLVGNTDWRGVWGSPGDGAAYAL